MIITLLKILFIVLSGVVNRIRGGMMKFLPGGIGKILAALFHGIAAILITHFMVSYPWAHAAIMGAVVAVGHFLFFVTGWGSYYDIGTWENEDLDKPEVAWIDWVLFKLFGPKWICSVHAAQAIPRYDLIISPTGSIRPFAWRRMRDAVGMTLRGSYIIALFVPIAIVKYLFGEEAILTGLIALPMMFLFGGSYVVAWIGFKPTDTHDRIWLAEILFGLLLGASLLCAYTL